MSPTASRHEGKGDSTHWSRRRVDPITLVVGVVALITYVLHGFNGYLSRDLAVYAYAAQQFAEGVPPYVGILNRAGPLAHIIPSIGVLVARGTGINDLLGMRLLYMLLAVACVCVTYLLGRDVFESRLAGVATAAAMLSFSGFVQLASFGPREKTPMALFLTCALLALHRKRWLVGGFCLSIATLVLQTAFPVGLVAMVVALVGVRHGERVRSLLRFGVGGLVPVAAFLVYFAAVGALTAFLRGFLWLNVTYTEANPFLEYPAAKWHALHVGFRSSLWVMLVGLAALLVLSLAVFRRERRRQRPGVVSVAALGAGALVGVVWTLRDFDGWPDAVLVLPLAAVGIGGLVKEVVEGLRRNVALALTLTWVVAGVALAVSYSLGHQNHRLLEQRASVDAVLTQLPPNASILGINAPQALVLSGKSNPTRFQMITNGLDRYVDDTWPGGLAGFADWIDRRQPTVITVGGRHPPSWLAGVTTTDYRRVGHAPGWTWYVNRSVGPDVISAVRHATRGSGRPATRHTDVARRGRTGRGVVGDESH